MPSFLFVFYYFFKAWLVNLTINTPKSKFDYASKNLFYPTFRIPESERYSNLLIIKKYVDFARNILTKKFNHKNASTITPSKNGVFIYDVFKTEYEGRKNYTEYFSNLKVNGAFFKHELYKGGWGFDYLCLFILVSLISPFLFLQGLFNKDKAPYAIIGREILENYNLLKLIREFKATEIFFFCIFEKDANISTLILQSQGVKVNKVPSEVPLGIWNKIVIADKLCVCNGYQFDELEYFNQSMFINETVFWGPELVLENISKYNKSIQINEKAIGFYSTGAWVRKLENHFEQNFESEEYVKKSIKEFLIQNPSYSLIIYLHPRERWDKYIEQALNRYQLLFSGIEYKFSERTEKTAQNFEQVNVAIALNSTIIYERLYYGFKTLIMPIGFKDFPIKASKMKNICVYTAEELIEKMEVNLALTNQEFFSKNGILHYAKFLNN